MKKILYILSILLFCATYSYSQKINMEQSLVYFSASNMVFTKVSGTFGAIEGEANINEGDLKNSYINTKLYVQTLNTGNTKRDDHLKESYYFDAAKYPTITFSSINIQKNYNTFVAKGELTIKNITKWVNIPFRIEGIDKNSKRMIGKMQLKRKDFDLGAETSDLLVSDKIDLEIICVVNRNDYQEEKKEEPINNIIDKTVNDSFTKPKEKPEDETQF